MDWTTCLKDLLRSSSVALETRGLFQGPYSWSSTHFSIELDFAYFESRSELEATSPLKNHQLILVSGSK